MLSGIGQGPRTVLVTGAAGSGVTTSAAALALVAARSGHKTLVLGAGGPARLSDVLGADVGDEPVEVEPGLYRHALGVGPWARSAWQIVKPALEAAIGDLGVDSSLLADVAGSPLAVSILHLAHLRACLSEGRWELIVLDAGDTSAAFDLLAAPERVRDLLERVLPVERRVERAVRAGAAGGLDPLLAGLPNVTAHVRDLQRLVDEGNITSVVVTSPQARPDAARDAIASLSLLGQDVAAVLVNQMVPAGGDDWQAEQSAAHARVVAGLADEFGSQHRTVRGLGQLVVRPDRQAADEVPFELASQLADLDLLQRRPTRGIRLERVGPGFELRFALAGVHAGDVDLRRRGDDLLISLGGADTAEVWTGHRGRVLRLPSVLRRCDAIGARLRDGEFVVTFRPDPRLWGNR